MTSSSFSHALGDIDEKYLKEATSYRAKSNRNWIKWASVAAVVCLAVGIALPLMLRTQPNDEAHNPPQSSYTNEYYSVVEYVVPESYESAGLHIATTSGLEGYNDYAAKFLGKECADKGIRVFSLDGESQSANINVWYLIYENGHIARIRSVSEYNGKYITCWFEAEELGRAIESLASKTSFASPMMLAYSGEMIFAVIDDTAYYLPGFTDFRPETDSYPEIDLIAEGIVTDIIVLP